MKLILDNGKEVELSKELKQQLEKVIDDNTKENPYREPYIGQSCYYIDYTGEVCSTYFYGSEDDGKSFNIFRIFLDKEIAEKEAFRDKVDKELLKFSMEHDGYKIDWDNYTDKYYIYYNSEEDDIWWTTERRVRNQGTTYFYSEEIVNQAIDLFREDLIKYFKM